MTNNHIAFTNGPRSNHLRPRVSATDEIEDAYRKEFVSPGTTNQLAYGSSQSNRPPDSKWKQQKLPSWQPIWTPVTVIITFYMIGFACISLGSFMFITNNKVQEYVIDYTDCNSSKLTNQPCFNRWNLKLSSCQCMLSFDLPEPMESPIFLYYSLEGFYQNHRRYVTSLDRLQLMGQDRSLESIRSSCTPYSDINGKIIAPCGAIANSMFSDEFAIRLISPQFREGYKSVPIKRTEISWPFDRYNLFKNPPTGFDSFAKPFNWSKPVNELDRNEPENNGYQNEHFMVWMRTAAFPTFRKLWGRIDTESFDLAVNNSLPAGSYQIVIDYEYPTVMDHLRIPKKVIISNMSWMGGKNYFLPITYIIVGLVCIVTATLFIVISKNHSHDFSRTLNNRDEMKQDYQSTGRIGTLTTPQSLVPEPSDHIRDTATSSSETYL